MVVAPFREAIDAVALAGGEALKQCYQCGLCTGTCPWNLVKTFPTRKLIHQAQLGLVDFESEDTWTCATCRACVARCPRGVAIIDIMMALRNIVAEMGAGHLPDSLRVTLKNIAGTGNPLGEPAERRTAWINPPEVTPVDKDAEILYFSCCIPAYDPNVQRVARSTARVLHKAGVRFAVIGARESCCGESVRKSGNESLFQKLAQSNIAAFAESGINKIVVTSPHCYYTFKNEYPKLGGNFEVIHYTEYMLGLLREGRLKLTKPVNAKVTYHDPCYLGRHSGIYDAPRELLESIPGIELVEMPDHGPDSICCGGGGGRIWMETKKGERLSDLRLDQAAGTGAGILAAACPYCILNFEDSILTTDRLGKIQVKDISELLADSL
ncbi:MAG: (Fe-S)-binding protein [Dehalococcoidia bacterium]|nr:(Fe-S)-binding protein [Dehalococcoidia bacterium]